MFSKGELSVLHNTRRKFVKELLRNIGPNEAVEHYCSRVKESNSIAEKLEKRNLQPTADNAAAYLTDLIGVRITSMTGLVRCSGKHSMKNVLVKAMERKK